MATLRTNNPPFTTTPTPKVNLNSPTAAASVSGALSSFGWGGAGTNALGGAPADATGTQQSTDALWQTVPGFLQAVRSKMDTHLRSGEPEVDELVSSVQRYHGKMLRPTLVLLGGIAANPALLTSAKTNQDILPALADHITVAGVLETIHLATLVHDDVLDEAETRRGHDTVNKLSGTEKAVILGDYLFSRAYHLCSTLQDQRVALRVGEVTSHVCRGEMLQLARRGDALLDEDAYFRIIEGKTASLIAAACELGAAAGGVDPVMVSRLRNFGTAIGLAFQIQDDLLDLTGEQDAVGKPLGRDAELGKMTLPAIHHRSKLQGKAADDFDAHIAGIVAADDHWSQAQLCQMMAATGSIDYARNKAWSLVEQAKAQAAALPAGPGRETLLAVADRVIQREQ